MRRTITSALVLAAFAMTACVGGSNDTSKEDKERLKSFILDKAPENIPVKLSINFDNKVTLLGYRVEPTGVVKPGQKVKVIMYWRADKKLDDGWNLFTHVLDGSGERILNIDNVGPIREWRGTHQALNPSAWEQGKVYVDEQEFVSSEQRQDQQDPVHHRHLEGQRPAQDRVGPPGQRESRHRRQHPHRRQRHGGTAGSQHARAHAARRQAGQGGEDQDRRQAG